MANSSVQYLSDEDHINEDQIQQEYIDELEEIVEENIEGEVHNIEFVEYFYIGMMHIEEYERVRDQAELVDARNWELKLRCKMYEQELRITKRSLLVNIKDRRSFWKSKTSNISKKERGGVVCCRVLWCIYICVYMV